MIKTDTVARFSLIFARKVHFSDAILCAIRESACNNGLLGSKREDQGLLNSKREEVILLRRTCSPRDRTLLKKRADRPHR